MAAPVYHGPSKVSVVEVLDARTERPADALITLDGCTTLLLHA